MAALIISLGERGAYMEKGGVVSSIYFISDKEKWARPKMKEGWKWFKMRWDESGEVSVFGRSVLGMKVFKNGES